MGWNALKEYVGGALWVLPSAAGLIALAALNSTRRSTAPNPANADAEQADQLGGRS